MNLYSRAARSLKHSIMKCYTDGQVQAVHLFREFPAAAVAAAAAGVHSR